MPPRFNYTDERLEKIINSLDPSFNNLLELGMLAGGMRKCIRNWQKIK
ncbi:MAG: hypothetical protein JWO92_1921 [Chitinophagaceae bacterium]|nr:hypothetical protein [Chitinophagaceae bacterium]